MANTQSDMMRLVAGQRILIGPRLAWNPSTGNKLSLSTWSGVFTVKDFPGGTTLFAISTSGSVAGKGRLFFSTSARYYVSLYPGATSAYGGTDVWWALKISTAGRGGPLSIQRGKMQIEDSL